MTKRRGIGIICVLSTLALTGCPPGGERTSLKADIAFVSAAQTPIVHAPVYVVETVDFRLAVTEVLKTDERGRVLLEGAYCLPAVISARGGQVVIGRWNLAPSYQVTIKDGDHPSLDHFAGNLKANI